MIWYQDKQHVGGILLNYDELARVVERAMSGDDEAFAQLFIEFSKSVYYIALRLTQNEYDAHDVVQETMIALHKNLKAIRDAKTIVAYVNKIAFRQALRMLRKRSPDQSVDDANYALNFVAQDDDEFIPEAYVTQKERREYIISLVDGLNDKQRTVILLFYYKQMSIKQISETLEVDEAAVKMRLSRARAVLRDKLKRSANNLLQGVIPMSVLSTIFEMNADEVFTKEICSGLWMEIAEKLSIPVTAMTAVAAMNTAGATTAVQSGASLAAAGTSAGNAATPGTSIAYTGADTVSKVSTFATSSFFTVTTIIITCVASLAMFTALWLVGVFTSTTMELIPNEVTSYIAFTGGPFNEHTNINPAHAAVTSENINGELAPHHWWIIDSGGNIVYEGDGGTVDNILKEMIINGEYGDHILYFLMEDTVGNKYEISRQFTVINKDHIR